MRPGSGRIQPEVGEALLRRRAEQLLEHLDDGPVGDPVAVGEAASPHDRDTVEPGEELVGQTRLPHAGGTEHREQLAGAVGLGLRQRGLQATQLALSADHRARAPARRRLRANRHETVRRDRCRLALQLQGLHGLHDRPRRGRAPASRRRSGSHPAAPPARAVRPRSPRRRSRGAPPSPSRPRRC